MTTSAKTSVRCMEKNSEGKVCRGNIYRDQRVSHMAEVSPLHSYMCDKCGTKWTFTADEKIAV